MVIAAATLLGWREQCAMRRRVCSLEEAERIVEFLRLHISIRGLSLPMVLEEIVRAFPNRFSGVQHVLGEVKDVPVSRLWRACLQAGGLDAEASCILGDAIDAIAGGQIPERALDIAAEQLKLVRERASAQEKEKGKLPVAFGAAGGCLLTLILL